LLTRGTVTVFIALWGRKVGNVASRKADDSFSKD
jgi:hypothetical protein